ncbi:hypothetical protein N836_11505 [Leptolyngbya sp. Heron Island J]|uniref:hypothetical protein n=1 Tax=Leptolyngbya sp. Heron Island J TaxID=1385935 RepID=UPI0003B9541B|nr:hypothetical protein [Leptolyngbya sp. Heron Island J]ESA35618.1 hypothetical protein N836_11505 [Leptolyngbya sp. Heron Island J]
MIVGLLGFSGLIGVAVLVYWLTKFSIEDDFNDRERYLSDDTLPKGKISSNMRDCDQHR